MADLLAEKEPMVRVAGDGRIIYRAEPWQRWFAWHPVRLYMGSRYAWLRWIWRRCVDKNGIDACDYTDTPEKFGDGAG